MKAVILAAGRGRRLSPMNWNLPKCLLPCPQGTFLDNLLSTLTRYGIEEAVLVVGFEARQVECAARRHPLGLRFIHNPLFESTNTAYSLGLVAGELSAGVLQFNADVWFEPALIGRLLAYEDSALLVDAARRDPESVKVAVNHQGRILRIGKDLSPRDSAGEFVGIARFTPDLGRALSRRLAGLLGRPDGPACYFESALDSLLGELPVYAAGVAPLRVMEVDTPEDYRALQEIWNRPE